MVFVLLAFDREGQIADPSQFRHRENAIRQLSKCGRLKSRKPLASLPEETLQPKFWPQGRQLA